MHRRTVCISFLLLLGVSFIPILFFSNNSDQFGITDPIPTPRPSSGFKDYINLKWNRTFPNERNGAVMWVDQDEFYTISSEYLGVWNYVIISKWDESGFIRWEKQWTGLTGRDNIMDMWGDDNYLYGCGRTFAQRFMTDNETSTYLFVKWDKSGNEIYNLTWNTGFVDIFYKIWGDEQFLYLLGSSTNSTSTGSYEQPYNSNVTLLKLDFDGAIIWNRTWDNTGHPSSWELDFWGDNQNLYCLHAENTTIHTYTKNGDLVWNFSYPQMDATSIIGDSSYLYITSIDDYGPVFFKIDKLGNLISQRYLNLFHYPYDLCLNDEYLYATGVFYKDSESELVDIMKLDTNGNLLGNNSWSFIDLPFVSQWGYIIQGNGEHLYVTAESGFFSVFFLKWDVTPPLFLYFGVPPIAVIAVGTVLWIWIKPIQKYRRKKVTEQLQLIELEIEELSYQEGTKKLEDSLKMIEGIKDPDLRKKWELLHKKFEIDMHFIDKLKKQRDEISCGNSSKAYENLVKLLKDSNSESYAGFVDKRIVSDIMETLKSLSNED